MVELILNEKPVSVADGTSVAAALIAHAADFAPLCGMGVCMACRVAIDGRPHQLACQTLCRQGMRVCST
ncbi:MAG: 2Fe-2S iron-sulfur cluster binding domain-containing protein [Acidobacteria bacterium]|nr:2Fe-2S iron-sulfur cluster binding domain-containing protein [Acidobacteriota bacterium]